MLEIKDLHVSVDGKEIIKGFNLKVNEGEIHAIMGPNGSGKSTLARVIAGDPSYEVTKGEIWFKGENLLEMDPEERARAGVFMSFQYPVEVPGVNNVQFLLAAYNAKLKAQGKKEVSSDEFDKMIESKFADMKNTGGRHGGSSTAAALLQRFVNETPWAHLDIAGTAMGSPQTEISRGWASGWGVRLLDRLVRDHYEG